MAREIKIESFNVKYSLQQSATQIHITGGRRASLTNSNLWICHDVLINGEIRELRPMSLYQIIGVADKLGLKVFGGDQFFDLETPLMQRFWTPLHYPAEPVPHASDMWNNISETASEQGNEQYAMLAQHIGYSILAAGMRLRDASDGYHHQLLAALAERRISGSKFSNVAQREIELAFHSVLSELASTRDYIATIMALDLGTPDKIDDLSRLKGWIDKQKIKSTKLAPALASMLAAYDSDNPQNWLYQITQYRNRYIHRNPIGSSKEPPILQYDEIQLGDLAFPKITLAVHGLHQSDAKIDALDTFIGLYRSMSEFAKFAAEQSPYPAELPSITVI